jgi:ribosomal protein S18 acetylase RimI-like enzyme
MRSDVQRDADALEVLVGLLSEHRRAAAELYYDAFFAKLNPILGAAEHGVAILEHDFDTERAITAIRGGRLVGIAGLRHDGRQLAALRLRTLAAAFGWPGALLKAALLDLVLARPERSGELALDGLVVASNVRGQGIGTRLLEEAFGYARAYCLSSIRLEVADENSAARRLYHRMGFVAVGTSRRGFLHRRLGFPAITTMVRPVD